MLPSPGATTAEGSSPQLQYLERTGAYRPWWLWVTDLLRLHALAASTSPQFLWLYLLVSGESPSHLC